MVGSWKVLSYRPAFIAAASLTIIFVIFTTTSSLVYWTGFSFSSSQSAALDFGDLSASRHVAVSVTTAPVPEVEPAITGSSTVFDAISATESASLVADTTEPSATEALHDDIHESSSNYCPELNDDFASPSLNAEKRFPDILLVVHFNHPHYTNVRTLEYAYSKYFHSVVFTGPTPHPGVINCTRGGNGGALGYACLSEVLSRLSDFGAAIKGILLVHDDLVVFPRHIPTDYFEDPSVMITIGRPDCSRKLVPNNWWAHCNVDWGFPAVDRAMIGIKNSNNELLIRMAHELGWFASNDSLSTVGFSDIFYLSSRQDITTTYIALAQIFADAGVFLEIALPYITVFLSSLPTAKLRYLKGLRLWGADRSTAADANVQSVINSSDLIYLHPLKLGTNTYGEREAFCNYFL